MRDQKFNHAGFAGCLGQVLAASYAKFLNTINVGTFSYRPVCQNIAESLVKLVRRTRPRPVNGSAQTGRSLAFFTLNEYFIRFYTPV